MIKPLQYGLSLSQVLKAANERNRQDYPVGVMTGFALESSLYNILVFNAIEMVSELISISSVIESFAIIHEVRFSDALHASSEKGIRLYTFVTW